MRVWDGGYDHWIGRVCSNGCDFIPTRSKAFAISVGTNDEQIRWQVHFPFGISQKIFVGRN